jgi:carboxypeptidase Taq
MSYSTGSTPDFLKQTNTTSASGQTIPGMPAAASQANVPNPKADLASLDDLERHLFAHRFAQTGMACYGLSIDPPAATADRSEAQAILAEEDHELLCSKSTGDLLARLSAPETDELLDETRKAQVRVLTRDRKRLIDVPPSEQAAFTRLTAKTHDVWLKAKKANDWPSFEPYLERIVEAMRQLASHKNPDADPYDVWLDEFEQGSDHNFYDRFFEQVKDMVVPLIADIAKAGRQPSHRCVEGHFDERRQWELAGDLARLEGIDPATLFLTHTEHPFSDALTTNYGIIAAHVHEDDILSNVYTMLHEGGHVLYEQGVNPAYNYTSLKGGTSSGMHEAQSRFFENYVGRSEAFATPLLKTLRHHFPGQFSRVTARQLYLASNRVVAQPIRTEADELTYPLHILVRYEIEKLLFSGEAKASDVPSLWASRYKSYLGVRVPSAAQGALQDTHWADGLFGYFPTYALGGAYGAQLRHTMIADGMDWDTILSSGDLSAIRSWLREHVWCFGRSKDPSDILLSATGEPLQTRYYTDYLTEKFSSIYEL